MIKKKITQRQKGGTRNLLTVCNTAQQIRRTIQHLNSDLNLTEQKIQGMLPVVETKPRKVKKGPFGLKDDDIYADDDVFKAPAGSPVMATRNNARKTLASILSGRKLTVSKPTIPVRLSRPFMPKVSVDHGYETIEEADVTVETVNESIESEAVSFFTRATAALPGAGTEVKAETTSFNLGVAKPQTVAKETPASFFGNSLSKDENKSFNFAGSSIGSVSDANSNSFFGKITAKDESKSTISKLGSKAAPFSLTNSVASSEKQEVKPTPFGQAKSAPFAFSNAVDQNKKETPATLFGVPAKQIDSKSELKTGFSFAPVAKDKDKETPAPFGTAVDQKIKQVDPKPSLFSFNPATKPATSTFGVKPSQASTEEKKSTSASSSLPPKQLSPTKEAEVTEKVQSTEVKEELKPEQKPPVFSFGQTQETQADSSVSAGFVKDQTSEKTAKPVFSFAAAGSGFGSPSNPIAPNAFAAAATKSAFGTPSSQNVAFSKSDASKFSFLNSGKPVVHSAFGNIPSKANESESENEKESDSAEEESGDEQSDSEPSEAEESWDGIARSEAESHLTFEEETFDKSVLEGSGNEVDNVPTAQEEISNEPQITEPEDTEKAPAVEEVETTGNETPAETKPEITEPEESKPIEPSIIEENQAEFPSGSEEKEIPNALQKIEPTIGVVIDRADGGQEIGVEGSKLVASPVKKVEEIQSSGEIIESKPSRASSSMIEDALDSATVCEPSTGSGSMDQDTPTGGFGSFGLDTKPKNAINPMFGSIGSDSQPKKAINPVFGQPSSGNSGSTGFGASSTISAFGSTPNAAPADSSKTQSVFGGQSAFTTPTKPATTFASFGNTSTPEAKSAFGQSTNSQPAFGSTGFGNAQQSGFSTPQKQSAFGASGSVFGQSSFGNATNTTSAFGSSNTAQPAFGQSGFGNPVNTKSAFGSSSSAQPAFGQSSFGNTANTSSAFGSSSTSQPAFGQSAFGNTANTKSAFGSPSPAQSAFGQSSFGTTTNTQSGFGSSSPAQPAFGQSSFGTATNSQSAFGSPSPAQPAFGQSGFGTANSQSAFGSPSPAFGQTGFGTSNTQSAFGTPKPTSTFGSSASPSVFGQSGFGAASGQPAFGQSSFGTAPTSAFAIKSTSAFASFSNQPTGFAAAAQAPSAFGTGAGFGQNSNQTSAFGSNASPQQSNPFGTPNPQYIYPNFRNSSARPSFSGYR